MRALSKPWRILLSSTPDDNKKLRQGARDPSDERFYRNTVGPTLFWPVRYFTKLG